MRTATILALVALIAACGKKSVEQGTAEPYVSAQPASFDGAQSGGINQPFASAAGQGAMAVGAANLSRLPASAVVLTRAAIEDPGLIARGPALNALIPAGWRTQGGVVAARSLCGEPVLFDWRATSPDRRSTVALFPTEIWQWSNSQMRSDCRPGQAATLRDYLSERIAAAHPDARVLDYRERPDFAQGAREAAEISERALNAAMGGASHTDIRLEGGEALYAFSENGVDMRGLMSVVATFHVSEASNPMAASPEFDTILHGQPFRSIIGATLGTFAATAPAGALDLNMTEAVRRSFTPDPRWLAAYLGLKNEIGAIQTQGVKERAAIIVAGGAAATKSNIAAFEAMAGASIANSNASIDAQRPRDGGVFPSDASGDRMQRERIEAIRGVETYHDPIDNTRVQLDMTYDHAWRVNGSQSYILTKDPNFNPGAYGLEATQMGVVQ